MIVGRIQKLDDLTASKIAAGEVVEKPATVVKELVENAIDAGSTRIHVLIERGGKKRMQVIDNGRGIDRDDLSLVFERHATSKIVKLEDLYETTTLGFRGEALASISAVSEVELITRTASDDVGVKALAKGGKIVEMNEVGALIGTTISVVNLFYNTPARLKFLKSDQAETRHISELMSHLALSHPEIAIEFTQDGKTIFQTAGDGQLKNTIYEIYDREMVQNIFVLNHEALGINLSGYASTFAYTKGNSTMQTIFINGRYVKSDLVKEAIMLAYKPYLMGNRFPVCFLFLEIAARDIDVNIHPAKTEIKFHHEGDVKQVVYSALRKAFNLQNQMPSVKFTEKEVFNVSKWENEIPEATKESSSNIGSKVQNQTHMIFKTQPKTQPKTQVKIEPIIDSKIEASVDPKIEASVDPKIEASVDPKIEATVDPKIEATVDPKIEAKLELELDTIIASEADVMPEKNQSLPGRISPTLLENGNIGHGGEKTTYAKTTHGGNISIRESQKIDFSAFDLSSLSDFADEIETFNKPMETQTIYDDLIYIGSFLKTYLIFEKGESMYMVDQHAAHEKILYETFMKAYAEGKVDTQMMLIPETIGYSIAQSSDIDVVIRSMRKAGFDIETFGPKTLVIRGIPSFMSYKVAERLVKEVLDGMSGAFDDLINEKLMSKACKAAIKAYDGLDNLEVTALLSALKTLESPYTCPHGRPIIIEMTKVELERKFKRIL